MALTAHRCLNHGEREAAARCPQCRQFFCRECVTEHEGRVLCAGCLARLTAPAATAKRGFGWLLNPVWAVTGVFVAWLCFYALGSVLLALPSEWHEGTLWQRLQAE